MPHSSLKDINPSTTADTKSQATEDINFNYVKFKAFQAEQPQTLENLKAVRR